MLARLSAGAWGGAGCCDHRVGLGQSSRSSMPGLSVSPLTSSSSRPAHGDLLTLRFRPPPRVCARAEHEQRKRRPRFRRADSCWMWPRNRSRLPGPSRAPAWRRSIALVIAASGVRSSCAALSMNSRSTAPALFARRHVGHPQEAPPQSQPQGSPWAEPRAAGRGWPPGPPRHVELRSASDRAAAEEVCTAGSPTGSTAPAVLP